MDSRVGSEEWSVQSCLSGLGELTCIATERFSPAHVRPADDPHFDVANVLMSMNNPSYQSFGRPTSKVVDVTDLREALGESTSTRFACIRKRGTDL